MQHPGVVPQLVVVNSEVVQARVVERTLDLGFIEGDSHLPALITDVGCEDELQVVCATSHRLASSRNSRLHSWPSMPISVASPGPARERSSTAIEEGRIVAGFAAGGHGSDQS